MTAPRVGDRVRWSAFGRQLVGRVVGITVTVHVRLDNGARVSAPLALLRIEEPPTGGTAR
jgi:hypothetical protein